MLKKLFIPGPVNVKEDVLQKMSTPMISHRNEEASILQKNISDKLRKLMFTKNEILLSTSSGSGLMEGAIRSCTRRRAAVFSCGSFGNRWSKIASDNGVPADRFEVEWGAPNLPEDVDNVLSSGKYDLVTITHNETSTGVTNPLKEISQVIKNYPEIVFCVDAVSSLGGIKIEVDNLGIDICLTSSQKCLAIPPGFSLCSFSKKAINAAKKVLHRGFYFDLLQIYEHIQENNYQYPFTASLSHMFALDYQLDNILLKEGLENRFDRHKELGKFVRNWAKKYFKLFALEKYSSNTVTCIKNTRNINIDELNERLKVEGYVISNGIGKIKNETFRIGHMGETKVSDLEGLIITINGILKL